MSESFVLAVVLIDYAFLLFLAVYFIITLLDLESDYLNASSCCSKLNIWVLPELIGLCVTPLLLLYAGHWILFLINMPYPIYMINRYMALSPGSIGYYDPTEIHNRGLLKRFVKEAMMKLAYVIVWFFVLLYCFIYSLLVGSSS